MIKKTKESSVRATAASTTELPKGSIQVGDHLLFKPKPKPKEKSETTEQLIAKARAATNLTGL